MVLNCMPVSAVLEKYRGGSQLKFSRVCLFVCIYLASRPENHSLTLCLACTVQLSTVYPNSAGNPVQSFFREKHPAEGAEFGIEPEVGIGPPSPGSTILVDAGR